MDNAQIDDIKELVLKLAAITGQIDQRNRDSMQRLGEGVQVLATAATRLQGGADQFADNVMRAVGQQVRSVVAQHSTQALDGFNEQLRVGSDRVKWATEAMAEQRRMLTAVQRTLVWKGLIALSIGSVLAVFAAGWLFWQARQAGGDPVLAAGIRQAVRSGALARCDGGGLCARTVAIPKGSKKAQQQYVIVR